MYLLRNQERAKVIIAKSAPSVCDGQVQYLHTEGVVCLLGELAIIEICVEAVFAE